MEDLKKKGYLKEEIKAKGPAALKITAKTERALRKNAMQQLFGNIKKVVLAIINQRKVGRETMQQVNLGISNSEIVLNKSQLLKA